jgi:septal ring factor EnvC (AmiA/AmiB activator)
MAGDIESNMQFIIQQQAQFAADIRALKERQAEAWRHTEANERQIQANTASIRQLVDVTLSLARHTESLSEHAEDTDKKLNALIDTVDKLVRRNGGAA